MSITTRMFVMLMALAAAVSLAIPLMVMVVPVSIPLVVPLGVFVAVLVTSFFLFALMSRSTHDAHLGRITPFAFVHATAGAAGSHSRATFARAVMPGRSESPRSRATLFHSRI